MFGFEGIKNIFIVYNEYTFLDSSMVEHSAVNRVVVGSSPTRGAEYIVFKMLPNGRRNQWLHGQAVKTSPFHGGNTGSIPVGVTPKRICGPLAQLVRATGS